MTRIPHPTTAEAIRAARILADLYATSEDVERGILSLRATEHRAECALALEILREAVRQKVVNEVIENDETEANHGRAA